MKFVTTIFITLILLLIYSLPGYSQYTLEQTLGAPYTQSIHSSADGKALAWVVNEKGARNIWYTDVVNISAKKMTNYDLDDGQDISQIIISNGYMIFVRGNGNNRYDEPANPASLSSTPLRQILRLRLSDKKIDTIDVASSPLLGPDDKQLVYSKGGKVFILDDISSENPNPELLFEVRQGAGSLTWSPDGNSIAFVSNRNDHSFVGYYSIPKDKISWVSPSYSFDSNPYWSPDGNQIAFLRSPGSSNGELLNIMSGVPFEIMVADLNGGNAKSIWKSPSDDGGFSQFYPNAPLRWTKGNKLLFYSEHEGWNHIYSINPDGSGIKDLTPGACEVENSDLSADHNELFYSGNCEDINRRHIWKVNIATGATSMVSDKTGIQTHATALDNEVIAYREGTFNTPTTAVIQKSNSKEVLGTFASTFPKNQLAHPEAVQFKSADGLTIHGQLFLSSKKSKSKKPAVIFMHGGPIRQMLLGYHYSGYYANAYIMNQYLASQGYVVLAVNYRDGIGYGQDFRLAENQGPRGASEYKDILAAGKYLQSRPEVNPEQIGLWGGSYGGYLTAMGLAKNSDLFKAGVDLHGVHDWAWRGKDFSPGGFWGITEDLMDVAYDSSPISELQFWSSPVLIVHGDDDRNVMFGQSIDLKNKLDALGVYNEALIFPDEVHGFLRYESWLITYKKTLDFFDRFLKE